MGPHPLWRPPWQLLFRTATLLGPIHPLLGCWGGWGPVAPCSLCARLPADALLGRHRAGPPTQGHPPWSTGMVCQVPKSLIHNFSRLGMAHSSLLRSSPLASSFSPPSRRMRSPLPLLRAAALNSSSSKLLSPPCPSFCFSGYEPSPNPG